MANYRSGFKRYLTDLAKKKPSPGGGSAVALSFCLGISLMEKAVIYSYKKPLNNLKQFRRLKAKVYPYIDKDSYLFAKIMNSRGKTRQKFIGQSEKMVVEIAKASQSVFLLAKGIESGIKKSIISDFNIGLKLIKVVFLGCIMNLEANAKMFKTKNKNIKTLKKALKKWPKY
jgi:formiminotetrahydrofolate cyclodeaminase